ncbi:MAG: hypothetical protein LBL92_01475, partial [Propionibacteriaceae bacterium]|nr:hypothetical protein [Propionibacteriaceae bacterium]
EISGWFSSPSDIEWLRFRADRTAQLSLTLPTPSGSVGVIFGLYNSQNGRFGASAQARTTAFTRDQVTATLDVIEGRDYWVTVGGGGDRIVPLQWTIRAGYGSPITAQPETVTIPAEGGSQTITITSPGNMTITNGGQLGTGTLLAKDHYQHTVSKPMNTTGYPLTGTVTITAADGRQLIVTVTQPPMTTPALKFASNWSVFTEPGQNPVLPTLYLPRYDWNTVTDDHWQTGKDYERICNKVLTNQPNWTATSTEPWITITPTTGHNGDQICFTTSENTTGQTRTNHITIWAPNITSALTYTITQYATPNLNIPEQLTLDPNGGNTSLSIGVTPGIPWVLDDRSLSAKWFTIQPTTHDTTSRQLTLNTTPNTTGKTRTRELTITTPTQTKTITVTQGPQPATPTPTPTPTETPDDQGMFASLFKLINQFIATVINRLLSILSMSGITF